MAVADGTETTRLYVDSDAETIPGLLVVFRVQSATCHFDY
jgi:hypothetical protein